jgi:glycerol-3-phosphate O-acyltransferase / dihydroxyacetone phosphate acyltransferase
MALGAMARNPNLKVQIIPCGLNYFSGHRFRSHVVVEFGKPIEISPELVESYKNKAEARKAGTELLQTVQKRLLGVSILFVRKRIVDSFVIMSS